MNLSDLEERRPISDLTYRPGRQGCGDMNEISKWVRGEKVPCLIDLGGPERPPSITLHADQMTDLELENAQSFLLFSHCWVKVR